MKKRWVKLTCTRIWGCRVFGVLLASGFTLGNAQSSQAVKIALSDENLRAVLSEDLQPDTSACKVEQDRRLTAVIHVKVKADGLPDKVKLEHGTNDTCLDGAAMLAVQKSLFFPAQKGQKAVTDDVVLYVDFGGLTADQVKDLKTPVTPPQVLHQSELSFGDCRVKKDSEYHVKVGMVVDVHGTPTQVKVLSSTGETCLDEQAKRAARGSLFAPALQDGKPVPFKMAIEMQYNN